MVPSGAISTAPQTRIFRVLDIERERQVLNLESAVGVGDGQSIIVHIGRGCRLVNLLVHAVVGEVLRSGDRAGRPHDLQYLAGSKAAHLNGPVERHLERAGRVVDQQVVSAGAGRPRGAHDLRGQDLRAGHDQRQRRLIKGRLEDGEWIRAERDRRQRLGHGSSVNVARRQACDRCRQRVLIDCCVRVLVVRVVFTEDTLHKRPDRRADGRAGAVVGQDHVAVRTGVVVRAAGVGWGAGGQGVESDRELSVAELGCLPLEGTGTTPSTVSGTSGSPLMTS